MFRPQTLSSHRLVVVALIVVVGLATTTVWWWNTHRQEEARITAEFRQRLGDLNIDAFIQKPFELNTLLNAVAAGRVSE
jgi:hypothetical protein